MSCRVMAEAAASGGTEEEGVCSSGGLAEDEGRCPLQLLPPPPLRGPVAAASAARTASASDRSSSSCRRESGGGGGRACPIGACTTATPLRPARLGAHLQPQQLGSQGIRCTLPRVRLDLRTSRVPGVHGGSPARPPTHLQLLDLCLQGRRLLSQTPLRGSSTPPPPPPPPATVP